MGLLPRNCTGKRGSPQLLPERSLVGVQGNAESFIQGAIEGGHPEEGTRFFASSSEAGEFIAELVNPGDVLLVKGSRGVKMERIIEALDARFTRSDSASQAVGKSEGHN